MYPIDKLADYVKGTLVGALHERSPGWVDVEICSGVALASGADQYLCDPIPVGPFSLMLMYGEATFTGTTNGDLYLDTRVRVPHFGKIPDEFYNRLVLVNNTSSPYLRKGWLLQDIRAIDELRIYAESRDTASTITLNACSVRLVV